MNIVDRIKQEIATGMTGNTFTEQSLHVTYAVNADKINVIIDNTNPHIIFDLDK